MKESPETKHVISIDPYSIFLVIVAVVGCYFLYLIRQILTLLFLAFILMSALNPSVNWLQRKLRFPKVVAIFSLFIIFIGIIVLLLALILPPLVSELPNLINALALPPLPENIRHLDFTASEIGSLLVQIRTSFSSIVNIVTSTFSGIFSFLTVLVMTSYLLIDRENLHKKIVWFSAQEHHMNFGKEFLRTVEKELGGWVRSEMLLMFIVGAMTYIGLALLGIPYAVPLALLAGFLEILPNIGPMIAAVPAILITFTAFGPAMAGFVALFNIVVQQLENNLIVPKVMKDNAGVNPLITIVSILTGLKLAGVMGALFAVPVYIIFRAAYSIWLNERKKQLSE